MHEIKIGSEVGPLPPIWKPSGFYWGAQAADWGVAQFQELVQDCGACGIVRLADTYRDEWNYPGAPLAQILPKLRAYLTARAAPTIQYGTHAVHIAPLAALYTGTGSPDQNLPTTNFGGGDTSTPLEALSTAVEMMCRMIFTTEGNIGGSGLTGLGFAAAANPGDPGAMLITSNEVNPLWQGSVADYCDMLEAIWVGAQRVSPDIRLIAPSIAAFGERLPELLPEAAKRLRSIGAPVILDVHRYEVHPGSLARETATQFVYAMGIAGAPDAQACAVEFLPVAADSPTHRSTYQHATGLLHALHAYWRIGMGPMAHRLQKPNYGEPEEDPFREAPGPFPGWGMFTTAVGDTPAMGDAAWVALSQFRLWAGGELLECDAELAAIGVRAVAFEAGQTRTLVLSRWDEGAGRESIQVRQDRPGFLRRGREIRFDADGNDPRRMFLEKGHEDARALAQSPISRPCCLAPVVEIGHGESVILHWEWS